MIDEFIQYLKEHYPKHPKLNRVVEIFECIQYIDDNKESIKQEIAKPNSPMQMKTDKNVLFSVEGLSVVLWPNDLLDSESDLSDSESDVPSPIYVFIESLLEAPKDYPIKELINALSKISPVNVTQVYVSLLNCFNKTTTYVDNSEVKKSCAKTKVLTKNDLSSFSKEFQNVVNIAIAKGDKVKISVDVEKIKIVTEAINANNWDSPVLLDEDAHYHLLGALVNKDKPISLDDFFTAIVRKNLAQTYLARNKGKASALNKHLVYIPIFKNGEYTKEANAYLKEVYSEDLLNKIKSTLLKLPKHCQTITKIRDTTKFGLTMTHYRRTLFTNVMSNGFMLSSAAPFAHSESGENGIDSTYFSHMSVTHAINQLQFGNNYQKPMPVMGELKTVDFIPYRKLGYRLAELFYEKDVGHAVDPHEYSDTTPYATLAHDKFHAYYDSHVPKPFVLFSNKIAEVMLVNKKTFALTPYEIIIADHIVDLVFSHGKPWKDKTPACFLAEFLFVVKKDVLFHFDKIKSNTLMFLFHHMAAYSDHWFKQTGIDPLKLDFNDSRILEKKRFAFFGEFLMSLKTLTIKPEQARSEDYLDTIKNYLNKHCMHQDKAGVKQRSPTIKRLLLYMKAMTEQLTKQSTRTKWEKQVDQLTKLLKNIQDGKFQPMFFKGKKPSEQHLPIPGQGSYNSLGR